MTVRVLEGDCRDVLRTLADESVHMAITSPPYWGLRDYAITPSIWGGDEACAHEWGDQIRATGGNGWQGKNSQRCGRQNVRAQEMIRDRGNVCVACGAWRGVHGLEPSYQLYVDNAVEIFREVRRVLRPDGTLWLNLGDSYATGAGKVGGSPGGGEQGARWAGTNSKRPAMGKHAYADDVIAVGPMSQPNRMSQPGLKPKDLCGIPWRVALALQDDGWWLRQDIIWSKPNPMPEYLFLLSKSERYHFDQDAIKEESEYQPESACAPAGWMIGTIHPDGRTPYEERKAKRRTSRTKEELSADRKRNGDDGNAASFRAITSRRNKRSVWTVTPQPFSEAHFATFPPALVEPCILAGCPEGGTVLDPFGGAGTTGLVADRLKRDAILIELNPEYAAMARRRIGGDAPLLTEVA